MIPSPWRKPPTPGVWPIARRTNCNARARLWLLLAGGDVLAEARRRGLMDGRPGAARYWNWVRPDVERQARRERRQSARNG